MKCTICGNSNPHLFSKRHGEIYCRRCVTFSGEFVEAQPMTPNITLKLNYSLSKDQEMVSRQVLKAVKDKKDVLINAVTGAGKTELVYETMEFILKQRKTVGFATPRRDVVIELAPRIINAFPAARVTSVYGGHTGALWGDIIILTTHQLYRYPAYFDLLIVDEIDAFPYEGDEMLHRFYKRSVKGNSILLSATPSHEDLEEVRNSKGLIINLDRRYHGSPLPVPVFKKTKFSYLSCLMEIKRISKLRKQLFVFVPTIEIGKRLYMLARYLIPAISLVYSNEPERELKVKAFKEGNIQTLITTSILERGVTVYDLQVIVFQADHDLYTSSSLIQIAGRVGRKVGATKGEVVFLGEYKNGRINDAIETIKNTNRRASLSRFTPYSESRLMESVNKQCSTLPSMSNTS